MCIIPTFVASYTIPANTSESSATLIEFALTKGVITKFFIHFPKGSNQLARCQFLKGGYQIFPASTGEYFADNGHTLEVEEFYVLDESPTGLKWKVWNIDDTYSHFLRVTMVVLPLEVVLPLYGLTEVINVIKKQQDALYGILTGVSPEEET